MISRFTGYAREAAQHQSELDEARANHDTAVKQRRMEQIAERTSALQALEGAPANVRISEYLDAIMQFSRNIGYPQRELNTGEILLADLSDDEAAQSIPNPTLKAKITCEGVRGFANPAEGGPVSAWHVSVSLCSSAELDLDDREGANAPCEYRPSDSVQQESYTLIPVTSKGVYLRDVNTADLSTLLSEVWQAATDEGRNGHLFDPEYIDRINLQPPFAPSLL